MSAFAGAGPVSPDVWFNGTTPERTYNPNNPTQAPPEYSNGGLGSLSNRGGGMSFMPQVQAMMSRMGGMPAMGASRMPFPAMGGGIGGFNQPQFGGMLPPWMGGGLMRGLFGNMGGMQTMPWQQQQPQNNPWSTPWATAGMQQPQPMMGKGEQPVNGGIAGPQMGGGQQMQPQMQQNSSMMPGLGGNNFKMGMMGGGPMRQTMGQPR